LDQPILGGETYSLGQASKQRRCHPGVLPEQGDIQRTAWLEFYQGTTVQVFSYQRLGVHGPAETTECCGNKRLRGWQGLCHNLVLPRAGVVELVDALDSIS
jgi:hypothetical protein